MHIATPKAILEHVNITVTDPQKTAGMLCRVFDWHIRWEGPSLNKGYTVHVGSEDSYLALYSPQKIEQSDLPRFERRGGLNHIALVVTDLDIVKTKIKAEGYTPRHHANYEPGRRFYFFDEDEVEYEVVSYAPSHEGLWQGFLKEMGQLARFGSFMK